VPHAQIEDNGPSELVPAAWEAIHMAVENSQDSMKRLLHVIYVLLALEGVAVSGLALIYIWWLFK
jgi:hypothetical protein